MPTSEQVDRLELHSLIELIRPEDLRAVEKVLRAFAYEEDNVGRALNDAPLDQDPLTEHERAAIAEYEAALAEGKQFKVVEPDELLKEFGFADSEREISSH